MTDTLNAIQANKFALAHMKLNNIIAFLRPIRKDYSDVHNTYDLIVNLQYCLKNKWHNKQIKDAIIESLSETIKLCDLWIKIAA